MQITGWGRRPIVESEVAAPRTFSAAQAVLRDGFVGVARGLGRSYGDSSLASRTLDATGLDQLIEFDATTGRLRAAAGASLADILAVIVPRGWFLPVSPGTKFVTVGGAVAADVHGKNHHVAGTFGDHVTRLSIALANGEAAACSPTERADLFRATCGGMGLTGVILDVEFNLQRIASSTIDERIYRAANLDRVLELFQQHAGATYSVAWIDCLAGGADLGRSLLMVGEHAASGPLKVHRAPRLVVPIDLPSFSLNSYSVRAFNWLYYHRILHDEIHHAVHYDKFFYPLDGVHQWNRIYGKRGFTQYQFVLPTAVAADGMRRILGRIAETRRGSFLAVLKAFGKQNENLLSFPMEGLTLALDFKLEDGLFPLLDELDDMVHECGGRVYLAKDVRMSGAALRRGYPGLEEFLDVRRRYGAAGKFQSCQSLRLGIE